VSESNDECRGSVLATAVEVILAIDHNAEALSQSAIAHPLPSEINENIYKFKTNNNKNNNYKQRKNMKISG